MSFNLDRKIIFLENILASSFILLGISLMVYWPLGQVVLKIFSGLVALFCFYIFFKINHTFIRLMYGTLAVFNVLVFLLPSGYLEIISTMHGLYFLIFGLFQFITASLIFSQDKLLAVSLAVRGGMEVILGLAFILFSLDNMWLRLIFAFLYLACGVNKILGDRVHTVFYYPAVFDICLPYILKEYYKEAIPDEEDAPQTVRLSIRTGHSFIDVVGHTSFTYKGKTYTYGNHDPKTRRAFNLYGEGVFVIASEDSLARFNRKTHESSFDFSLQLSAEEILILDQKLSQLKKRTERWFPEEETKYIRVLSKVTDSQYYKFKEGQEKYYFLPGMNCVNIINSLLDHTSLPTTRYLDLPLPGSLLACYNRSYIKHHPEIADRQIKIKGGFGMIPKKYFPQVMTVLMTFFMTLGMTLVMTLIIAGQIHFPTIVYDILIAFTVALIANFLFPAGAYGHRLAERRGAEKGTVSYLLWMSIIPALFNGVIMTGVMTGLKVGFNHIFLSAYFNTLWIGILVGYIVSVIISSFINRLADALTSDPS